MKVKVVGLAALLLVVGVGSAQAALVETHTFSLPLATTNWSDTVNVPKFDHPGWTLTSVKLTLTGHVEGTAKFESLDAQPTTVIMNLSAILKLMRPDMTALVVTIPVAATSDPATAYDGVTDYDGTSGKTYPSLSGDLSNSSTTSAPADLALFTGTGNIALPADATGASSGSGAGNLVLQFNTSASSGGTVEYTYTVPEPATMGFLALGGLALVAARRRKSA